MEGVTILNSLIIETKKKQNVSGVIANIRIYFQKLIIKLITYLI